MQTGIVKALLKEGRDAPLYSWIDADKAKVVFSDDVFPATWEHKLDRYIGKRVWGSSMTRNRAFISQDPTKMFRLKFDQRQIAHTNRIMTVDAEYAGIYARSELPGSISFERSDRAKAKWSHKAQMSEEFVVGDIKRVHRCVTEVRHISSYDKILRDEIRHYKTLYDFERLGVFKWCSLHDIPLYWLDGTEVVDERDRLEQIPVVMDWMES